MANSGSPAGASPATPWWKLQATPRRPTTWNRAAEAGSRATTPTHHAATLRRQKDAGTHDDDGSNDDRSNDRSDGPREEAGADDGRNAPVAMPVLRQHRARGASSALSTKGGGWSEKERVRRRDDLPARAVDHTPLALPRPLGWLANDGRMAAAPTTPNSAILPRFPPIVRAADPFGPALPGHVRASSLSPTEREALVLALAQSDAELASTKAAAAAAAAAAAMREAKAAVDMDASYVGALPSGPLAPLRS